LPPEAAAQATGALLHLAGNLPPAVAALGAHALDRLPDLERRRHALQEGKRAVVDRWIERHRGVLSWTPPHPDSLFGFVHDARGRDLRPLLERGAADHGVLAAPGSFFGAPSAFRIGLTLPREKLEPALDALEAALEL
jgi:aspartate/methionine/tyrosine aminotransferase